MPSRGPGAGNPVAPERLDRIVIHAPNWLGDAVMALPLLDHVRAVRPAASIAIVSRPAFAGLWKLWPHAAEVIRFDPFDGTLTLANVMRFIGVLRGGTFDAAVILPGGIEFALFHALAGIPVRIGYDSDHRRRLLTHARAVPQNYRSQHHSHYYAALGHLLGHSCDAEREGQLPPTRLVTDKATTTSDVAVSRRLRVLFHPWATYGPAKRWPATRFAELGLHIADRFGAEIVLVGSADGRANATDINRLMNERALDLTGRTSIEDLCSVMRGAALVISNDSGPAHLAAALRIPVIVLFGSSSPTWTAPRGPRTQVVYHALDCSPCFERSCRFGTYACLHAITVDEVFQRVARVLATGSESKAAASKTVPPQ